MKRFLLLLLCLILVLGSAAACNGGNDDPIITTGGDNGETTVPDKEESTTAPAEQEEETLLKLVTKGVADCRIILPEDGSDAMFTMAKELADNMRDYLGEAPQILSDDIAGGLKDNDILIGQTRFAPSDEAAKLADRYEDWFCGVIDSSLVLYGNTDATAKSAVNYLTNNYIYINRKGSKSDLHISSLKNRLSIYKYNLQSVTLGGAELSDYTIVYPAASTAGERYAAVGLQSHFFEQAGLLIPTVADSTAVTGNRIVFETLSGSNGFAVKQQGSTFTVTGDDLFDFQDALAYLKTKLFAGKKEVQIEDGFAHSAENSSDALRAPTGDYRIWFHNVWGMDEHLHRPGAANDQSQNIRDDNAIALVLAYSPDVVCLNEYWGLFKQVKDFENALLANGYSKAPVENRVVCADGHNAMPVFYKTDRFTYVSGEYVDYGTGSDPSKGATFVILQDTTTAQRFGVVATHLSSAYNMTAEEAVAKRLENLEILDAAVRRVSAANGNLPMIVGGDMNAKITAVGDACQRFTELGYENMRELAQDKNDKCSCHGYPVFDDLLGVYNNGYCSDVDYADYAIDHAYLLNGETVSVETYRTLQDPIVPQISDHCPQLIDFSINQTNS